MIWKEFQKSKCKKISPEIKIQINIKLKTLKFIQLQLIYIKINWKNAIRKKTNKILKSKLMVYYVPRRHRRRGRYVNFCICQADRKWQISCQRAVSVSLRPESMRVATFVRLTDTKICFRAFVMFTLNKFYIHNVLISTKIFSSMVIKQRNMKDK